MALLEALLPEYASRVDWPVARIMTERRRALRELLRWAAASRRGIAGVDMARVAERDLASLPVMTKNNLMDNFDEVVTDRRTSHAAVNAIWTHYWVSICSASTEWWVSGGSSDRRGVFVYGWDAWAICWALTVR